jgi:hypothetical protein
MDRRRFVGIGIGAVVALKRTLETLDGLAGLVTKPVQRLAKGGA